MFEEIRGLYNLYLEQMNLYHEMIRNGELTHEEYYPIRQGVAQAFRAQLGLIAPVDPHSDWAYCFFDDILKQDADIWAEFNSISPRTKLPPDVWFKSCYDTDYKQIAPHKAEFDKIPDLSLEDVEKKLQEKCRNNEDTSLRRSEIQQNIENVGPNSFEACPAEKRTKDVKFTTP